MRSHRIDVVHLAITVIFLLGVCCSTLAIGQSSAEKVTASAIDPWKLDSGIIHANNYFGETVANGVLGIRSSTIPFKSGLTVIGGTYDNGAGSGVDQLLPVFNILDLDVSIDKSLVADPSLVHNYQQTLDMQHAALTTTFDYANKATIRYTWYSLRQSPYTALADITITAHAPIRLGVVSSLAAAGPLTGIARSVRNFKDVNTPPTPLVLLTATARSPDGRFTISATTTFLFEKWIGVPVVAEEKTEDGSSAIGFFSVIPRGQSIRFSLVASCISQLQNGNPRIESARLTIAAALRGREELIADHEHRWSTLWKSDIHITGDSQTQRDVHAMIYHLYSYAREGTDDSIPPMGLSRTQAYLGQIFWDADTWMFPTLLALHPEMARSLVMYRIRRLEEAQHNALANGYRGAMFPWESALSGDEETPLCCLTGEYEQHITADVALAVWQYYEVTQDIDWLRAYGWPLLRDTATFWASRVTRNGPGHYDILGVVAVDEFSGVVNDDAYTDGAAKANLAAAIAAAKLLGTSPNPDWQLVYDNIPILSFPDGTTREYQSYRGSVIKQADVNLLAYPLQEITNADAIRRNLSFYASRVPNGPAMTQSIFSILDSRLGDPNHALVEFKRGYERNQRPPFGALAEYATNNETYFATGAGGLLQAMIYGFGGLKITPNGLIQTATRLPSGWKGLTLTGIGPQHRRYSVE